MMGIVLPYTEGTIIHALHNTIKTSNYIDSGGKCGGLKRENNVLNLLTEFTRSILTDPDFKLCQACF